MGEDRCALGWWGSTCHGCFTTMSGTLTLAMHSIATWPMTSYDAAPLVGIPFAFSSPVLPAAPMMSLAF